MRGAGGGALEAERRRQAEEAEAHWRSLSSWWSLLQSLFHYQLPQHFGRFRRSMGSQVSTAVRQVGGAMHLLAYPSMPAHKIARDAAAAPPARLHLLYQLEASGEMQGSDFGSAVVVTTRSRDGEAAAEF